MTFHFILLDAAQGSIILVPIFVLHFVVTILIEAYFLKRFGSDSYKKSLLYAFEMNLASLVVGILVIYAIADAFNHIGHQLGETILISLLFVVTLIIEFSVIKLVKRSFNTPSLIKALLIGNVITYLLLIAIMQSL
jgi:hypothetical protein